mmetsp:Transcript_34138/g.76603  ORF Transcript_34138/g.76603 Transcript_34138/m.76603 type:complete len:331 (+) Transcript_34138:40-1032(+)
MSATGRDVFGHVHGTGSPVRAAHGHLHLRLRCAGDVLHALQGLLVTKLDHSSPRPRNRVNFFGIQKRPKQGWRRTGQRNLRHARQLLQCPPAPWNGLGVAEEPLVRRLSWVQGSSVVCIRWHPLASRRQISQAPHNLCGGVRLLFRAQHLPLLQLRSHAVSEDLHCRVKLDRRVAHLEEVRNGSRAWDGSIAGHVPPLLHTSDVPLFGAGPVSQQVSLNPVRRDGYDIRLAVAPGRVCEDLDLADIRQEVRISSREVRFFDHTTELHHVLLHAAGRRRHPWVDHTIIRGSQELLQGRLAVQVQVRWLSSTATGPSSHGCLGQALPASVSI